MTETKWSKLVTFMLKNEQIAYNDELKKKFTSLGKSALRQLANELMATSEVMNCKISYNKGGTAVSGDFHLYGDFVDGGSFDFFFNLDGFGKDFYFRKTRNQKDYTGGPNHTLRFGATSEKIKESILKLQGESL